MPVEPKPPSPRSESSSAAASAKEAGADLVITACPLCLYNLAHNASATTLPVKYFTELLYQALGLEEKEDA